MPLRNRISNSNIPPAVKSHISIEEEVSSTEGFDMDDLNQNNKSLREQIQAQVSIFEQYLRVAMLQQETEHFKKFTADEKAKAGGQEGSFTHATRNVSIEIEETHEQ